MRVTLTRDENFGSNSANPKDTVVLEQRVPPVRASVSRKHFRRQEYIDEDLIETDKKSAVPLFAGLILCLPLAEERDSSLSRI